MHLLHRRPLHLHRTTGSSGRGPSSRWPCSFRRVARAVAIRLQRWPGWHTRTGGSCSNRGHGGGERKALPRGGLCLVPTCTYSARQMSRSCTPFSLTEAQLVGVRELRAAVCNHSPLLVGTIYKDKMMMQHLVTQTMKIRAWEATTLVGTVNCSF